MSDRREPRPGETETPEAMTTCNHTHLVKTTLNHGTWEKDIYRCEGCNELLSVLLRKVENQGDRACRGREMEAISIKCVVANPVELMCRYLDGKDDLSPDEKEILMFALYCESKNLPGSIVQLAIQKLGVYMEPAKPRAEEPK